MFPDEFIGASGSPVPSELIRSLSTLIGLSSDFELCFFALRTGSFPPIRVYQPASVLLLPADGICRRDLASRSLTGPTSAFPSGPYIPVHAPLDCLIFAHVA